MSRLIEDLQELESERDELRAAVETLNLKFEGVLEDYSTLLVDHRWLNRYAEWVDKNYPEARATYEALEKLKESAK